MPKSKPNLKVKLQNGKILKVETLAVHGLFASHGRIKMDGERCDQYFSVSHLPTGLHIILLCPFKSKASELAKLLSQLVDLGAISSNIQSSGRDKAEKAFSKKARKFINKCNRLCNLASKARDMTFQIVFDEMFQKELNSKPKLEQQSLFGS